MHLAVSGNVRFALVCVHIPVGIAEEKGREKEEIRSLMFSLNV